MNLSDICLFVNYVLKNDAGWWYGVVGHSESCDGNESYCLCHNSGKFLGYLLILKISTTIYLFFHVHMPRREYDNQM